MSCTIVIQYHYTLLADLHYSTALVNITNGLCLLLLSVESFYYSSSSHPLILVRDLKGSHFHTYLWLLHNMRLIKQ